MMNSRPIIFGKGSNKRKGLKYSGRGRLNFSHFITDAELLRIIPLERISPCHPYESPNYLTLPRTGHRCLKVVNSLFDMMKAKLRVMENIKSSDGLLLANSFKFENTKNRSIFWANLYQGILQSILPFSKHGKNN